MIFAATADTAHVMSLCHDVIRARFALLTVQELSSESNCIVSLTCIHRRTLGQC